MHIRMIYIIKNMTKRYIRRSNLHKVLMVYSFSDKADKERFQEREIFILDLYHIILTRKKSWIFSTFEFRCVTKTASTKERYKYF